MCKQTLIVFFALIIASTFASHIRYRFNHVVRDDFKQSIKFYVAVKPNLKGVKQLERYILDHSSNPDSPKYGKYLSAKKIGDMLRPGHMQSIINDFRDVDVFCEEHGGTSLKCETSFNNFNSKFYNSNLYNSDSPIIPTHFMDRIDFIELANNKKTIVDLGWSAKHRTYINRTEDVSPFVSSGSITREVLLNTYLEGESGMVMKNRTSAGAIEFLNMDGFMEEDMVRVQVASDVLENRVPKNQILGNNFNPPDGESELDMSVIWQGAANVNLWYEDWNGWIFGWASNLFTRKDFPQVVSLSWGWNENDQCGAIVKFCNDSKVYVDRTNIELMKLAARGITICVSSGDAGSPGRTNEACNINRAPLNPTFPGGSPWILSVGGSYLMIDSNNSVVWKSPICKTLGCPNITNNYKQGVTSWDMTGWTSGAGFSNYSNTPEWQQAEVKHYLSKSSELPDSKYFNSGGRGYPDIIAYGHNCAMYDSVGGGWTRGDGTSCSAPIVAGIIAYLNDYRQSKGKSLLGFVNPLLYKMRRKDETTFNDISVGDSACTEVECCKSRNFGFYTLEGSWDVVSGLGSPNVKNIKSYLDKI